jgi:outer membrane protein
MKLSSCLTIVGVFCTLFFITSLSAQEQTLSLKDAVKLAIERNPTFRNALVDEQISTEKANEAGTRYYPRLTGTLDGRYNTQLPTSIIPGRAFSERLGDSLIKTQFGTNWNMTAALDLTQPILDMSISAEVAAAKASQNLASANTEKAKNDLKLTITRAYYTVLLNQEKLRQAEANLVRIENFYQDVQAKFQNANALKTDRSKAYLNFSNAALALKKAQDAVRISLANLASQLNWEGSPDNIRLTDRLDALFSADTSFVNRSLDGALDARADAKAELAQREVNVQNLARLRNQNLPTLSGYGYLGTQGLTNDLSKLEFFPLSYLGVRVSVPLADWFTRTPALQQQAYQLDKSENNLRNLRQTTTYELLNTQSALKNAYSSIRIQKENVAIAEEVVATATSRFKQGQAAQQEVLEAESTLRDTQLNYLQALYDALVAKLDWEIANGML